MDYNKRLDRISELALKSQKNELTKDELRERDILRREYVTNAIDSVHTHDEEQKQLVRK